MTLEELRELPETSLVNLVYTERGEDYENVIAVLKEKGYRLCGFNWTKDAGAKDPVDEMFNKIYGKN